METEKIQRNLIALLSLRGVGPGSIKKNLRDIHPYISQSDVFDSILNVVGEKADRASWDQAIDNADRVLERCDRIGIATVSIFDPKYPKHLIDLGTPPPILFCRGNATLLSSRTLGVIGSRKSTKFGEVVARRIGTFFSGLGLSICNGLADGIDMFSVAPEGRVLPNVIGVIPAGLDLLETKLSSNKTKERAFQVIEAGGLLVSELQPSTEEDQNSVIASCRLQAGLSWTLILVQSSREGGSRFTVRDFCKLERYLAYIVPPDSHSLEAAFEANLLLYDGKSGLAEFAGLKTSKTVRANLLPMRSKEDYYAVLKQFDLAV